MEFIDVGLQGAVLIKPRVFTDPRGFFLESYSQRTFSEHGITDAFVQDNHSRSVSVGVLRGLHFQVPPMDQAKLVRVTRGAVYDVIVDIRKSSPSYGAWKGFALRADAFDMLYVPRGFAHGFCTLEPNTEVQYKVDRFYSPQHESGIMWNDPTLGIPWPVQPTEFSAKDLRLSLFADLVSPF